MTAPVIPARGPTTEPRRRENVGSRPHPELSQRLAPYAAGAATALLGYLVLAAAMVGFGVLLTDVVLPGSVQRWDIGVVRFLIGGRPEWNTWSQVGSYLAEFATVLVVCGLMLAYCLRRGWKRLATILVVSISLEALVYMTATYFVTRHRPRVHRLEQLIVSDSFPSGHVAASVVMWVMFAVIVWTATRNRAARAMAAAVAVFFPVIVALSRMYRGMHHPTDTFAGYLMGWGCLAVGLLVVRADARVRSRRERETEAS